MEDRGAAAYVAEFLGTLILVSFVCLVLSVYNSQGGIGYTDFAVIGLLHMLVLMMLIYTLGGASGRALQPGRHHGARGGAQDRADRRRDLHPRCSSPAASPGR